MNTMKCVGLIGALLLPGAAQALEWNQDWSDWEVRPHFTTGFLQYKYEQEAGVGAAGAGIEALSGVEAEDTLLFAGIGVSVFLGNFFVDLAFQKSDEGEDDYTQNNFGLSETDTGDAFFFAAQQNLERQMDREEFTLSIGYALTDRIAVFAGYKQNDTQFEDNGTIQLSVVTDFAEADSTGILVRDADLEQDGFFLGATYVWPYESQGWLNGSLSIDLGVAFLDGDISSKDNVLFDFSDERAVSGDTGSGEAVGLNLGVTWSGPLTERLNYSVGVDGYQYSYEADGDGGDFEDTLFRFSVGVSYAIDAKGVF